MRLLVTPHIMHHDDLTSTAGQERKDVSISRLRVHVTEIIGGVKFVVVR
jgi:hypothetical protein